jgi:two-component system nitrate/nitrite response regulator NarL
VRSVPTILIEPNPLLREGLGRILRGSRFRLLHAAPKIDALSRLRPNSRALLCIMGAHEDCSTPHQICQIKEHFCAGQVVVLSARCDFTNVLAALRAGANGYLINTISCESLLKSLELITLNETVISFEFLSSLNAAAPPPWKEELASAPSAGFAANARSAAAGEAPNVLDNETAPSLEAGAPLSGELGLARARHDLSRRELTILRCLTSGASNKMIARELDISEATVKVHVKAILRKIRVHNRTQAAIWAMNCPGEAQVK